MNQNDSKLDWPENLRAIAAISVILLHVAAPPLYKYGTISTSHWWIGNVTDSFVRFCVPIFLMLTGALLLPKIYEISDFFKRRFSRLLLPFLLWSFIYFIYNFDLYWPKGLTHNFLNYTDYILAQMMKGTSYHLWYVYMILFFYFFFPILSKWITKSSTKEILFYLILWLFIVILYLPELILIKNRVNVIHIIGYMGYPMLGYLLAHRIDNKKITVYALPLFIACVIITALGTYFFTIKTGRFYPGFYFYLSPNVLFASIGIFLYFKNLKISNNFANKILNFISIYSYGIYLSHVLILNLLGEINITWQWVHPIVGIPVTALLGLTISTAIVYFINKLPYGSFFSG